MSAIKVLVNGARGRMGREAVAAVGRDQQLQLAGENDLGDDLESSIRESGAEVVVDFTAPGAVFGNTKAIIGMGVRPVIGTSGLLPEEVEELKVLAAGKKIGGIIAPNFAVGAVLMMKFAAEAAKHLPDVEIIELHHEKKADAPSGTAIKTAAMISVSRAKPSEISRGKEILPGARGARAEEVPIHSVRLPGLVAHQEVLFGGSSQTLSIRHDSIHRESFMPGVCLACRKVMDLDQLVYGLEYLL